MMDDKAESAEWVWPPGSWWCSGFPSITLILLLVSALANLAMLVVALLGQVITRHGLQAWAAGVVLAFLGASLIFHARLPLYRQRRFFTFGARAIPESRRGFYRWGYRFVFAGCGVLLLILAFH